MIAREQAEHFWPWKPKALTTTPLAARVEVRVLVDDDGVLAAHLERSARLIQIWPSLALAADSLMRSPTSLEPVNAMKRVFGCATM